MKNKSWKKICLENYIIKGYFIQVLSPFDSKYNVSLKSLVIIIFKNCPHKKEKLISPEHLQNVNKNVNTRHLDS